MPLPIGVSSSRESHYFDYDETRTHLLSCQTNVYSSTLLTPETRAHNNSTEYCGWMDGPSFSQSGRRTTPPATLPVWHSRTGRARIIMSRRRKKRRTGKGRKGQTCVCHDNVLPAKVPDHSQSQQKIQSCAEKRDCFVKHQPGVAGCGWLQPGRNFLST